MSEYATTTRFARIGPFGSNVDHYARPVGPIKTIGQTFVIPAQWPHANMVAIHSNMGSVHANMVLIHTNKGPH